MTLLLRDPDVKPDQPDEAAVPEAAPEVRTCPICSAPLEADQDWCLSCGSAQPGRLSGLPGKRAAATILALTTLLVGGAVAASYAALQKDGPAGQTGTTQVAQAPAPAPTATPSTAVPPADTSTAAPSTETPTTPADTGTIPDTSSKSPSIPSTPSVPSTPSSSGSTGSTSTGSTGSTSTGSTGSTGTSGSGDSTAQTRTSTTPTVTAPAPIKLDKTAAALYDPYSRDTASGDATKALDGNPDTSFPITVAPNSQTIGAGLIVDLGKLRGIRELQLSTKTPGFKVEIYATDSEEQPPDVLDTRWAHIKDVSEVGSQGSGATDVTLGSGSTKYRHLLLWVTKPPTDGLTVRLSELKVLG